MRWKTDIHPFLNETGNKQFKYMLSCVNYITMCRFYSVSKVIVEHISQGQEDCWDSYLHVFRCPVKEDLNFPRSFFSFG